MKVCANCGKEVEEGQRFCPYCAKPITPATSAGEAAANAPEGSYLQASAKGRERYLQEEDLEPPAAVPLSSFDERKQEGAKSQRSLFLIVGAASALVLVALALLFSTDAGRSFMGRFNPPAQEERLEGAIRPGSPEFDEAMRPIRLDFNPDENAVESARAIGDKIFALEPTIRNLGNRTVNGLELQASALDLNGGVMKQRTFIVIPKRQAELEPFKTYKPNLLLEGFKQNDFVANLRVEITGIRFKE